MGNYFKFLSIILAMAFLGVFVILAPWYIAQRGGVAEDATFLYTLSQISLEKIINIYIGFVAILSVLSFWFDQTR